MKSIELTAIIALTLSAGIVTAADKAALVEEAKGIVMQFGGTLKEELLTAVAEGGPTHAIGVCNERAPEIATAVSTDGWVVGRSSHALRNPENAPDTYTSAVIAEFLERQAAGETAADLAKAEIIDEDGQQVFRFVKAIPTGGVCLTCHGGDDVKPEIVDRLAELYPSDQARGFSQGEMRGVFTLSKILSE